MPPSRPSSGSKRPVLGRAESGNTTKLASKTHLQPASTTAQDEVQVHYTVLIRLPFPRGDFVDPSPVNWNASKEKALWNKLSQMGKGDIEWESLADQLDVSLQFLLQQAAWLYERQLSQVRAQMRKVGNPNASSAPSPVAGSESASLIAGGHAMRRGGSSGGAAAVVSGGQAMRRAGSGGVPRAPSSLSTRSKEGVAQKPTDMNPPSNPSGLKSQPMSRQSSANANSPRPPVQTSPRPAYALPRQPSSNPQVQQVPPKPQPVAHRPVSPVQDAPPSPLLSSISSSSSSSSPRAIHKSQAFKRPVRFTPSRRAANEPFNLSNSGDADVDNNSDDEDSDAAFLPFSAPVEPTLTSSQATLPDPSATLRNTPVPSALSARRHPPESTRQQSLTVHSSTSSNSSQPANLPQSPQAHSRNPASHRPPPVLSPQRAASIVARRQREGSEETPASMGSSFSDLDDASVTQSALEEALASDLRRGAGSVASRVSGLGQALKSRYL